MGPVDDRLHAGMKISKAIHVATNKQLRIDLGTDISSRVAALRLQERIDRIENQLKMTETGGRGIEAPRVPILLQMWLRHLHECACGRIAPPKDSLCTCGLRERITQIEEGD